MIDKINGNSVYDRNGKSGRKKSQADQPYENTPGVKELNKDIKTSQDRKIQEAKRTKKRVISHTDSLNLQIVWNAGVRWQARLMFLCPARPDSRGIVLSGCDFAVRRYLKVAVIHQET